jgi:hypothetical protein
MASHYENFENYSTRDLRRHESTATELSRWWNSCRRVRHVSCTFGYDTDERAMEDSTLPCFAASGDQTAAQLRERFQQALTHSLVAEHVDKLIDTSLGSTWTRLYDSVSLAQPSILLAWISVLCSISTILSPSYDHCTRWHIQSFLKIP